jgi:hypothetical protein
MLTERLVNLISLEMEGADPIHSEQNVNRLTLRPRRPPRLPSPVAGAKSLTW